MPAKMEIQTERRSCVMDVTHGPAPSPLAGEGWDEGLVEAVVQHGSPTHGPLTLALSREGRGDENTLYFGEEFSAPYRSCSPG